MIADIADALLPVFFVMALGFLAAKRRILDSRNVGIINSLVMTFAIPVALFTTVAGTKRGVIGENASLGVVVAASMIAVYVVVYAVRRSLYALSSGDAAVETLTVAFPNCAAVGLPLVRACVRSVRPCRGRTPLRLDVLMWQVVCLLMADAFGVHVRIAAIEVVAGRDSRRMRSLSTPICRREYGRWKLAHRHMDTLPSQREPEAARDREGMASAGERRGVACAGR